MGERGRGANRLCLEDKYRHVPFTIVINPLGKYLPPNKRSPKFDGEKHFQTKSLKIDTTKKNKMVYLKCDKYRVKNRFETHP